MIDDALNTRELDLLAIEIGNFIRYWGFKNIHGRVWTHIYISAVPLDAATLMKSLNVSKALMSLSLNDLLDFNVIQKMGKSPRGATTYIANPRIVDCILEVLKRRELKMLKSIDKACKAVTSSTHEKLVAARVNETRMKILARMIGEAQLTLNSILELSSLDFEGWNELNDIANEKTLL